LYGLCVDQNEELESTLEEVERNLELQAREADQAIAQWESQCQHLEERLKAVEGESTISETKSPFNESLNIAVEAVKDLETKIVSLEKEKRELQALLLEREQELQEVSNAVQIQISNALSDRATGIAAEGLREQIEAMRPKMKALQKALEEERGRRREAEDEVERLRADFAALVGMEDGPDARSEIRMQTIEARENYQRMERVEISELTEALTNAMAALSEARAAEEGAEERISRANLQVSIYEQELVAAKSDFKFLTERMDEMREAESSKREAMEYRIATLETNSNALRKHYTIQIENLENELSQITMDRDRLFQSLKDSERSKESLQRHHTGRETRDSEADHSSELTQLRLEKAQLLLTASEEASRVEKRLRQARAAAKASAEADIIVERELRLAAENAFEAVRRELDELRCDRSPSETYNSVDDHPTTDAYAEEIIRLNERIDSQLNELIHLQSRLEESLEKRRQMGEELRVAREECRQAKTRSAQLEREGRVQAEIAAERALLNGGARAERPLLSVENSAEEEREPATSKAEVYYDQVQNLQKQMQEERQVYQGLLREHDDLLMMLNQYDITRTELSSALQAAAGEGALQTAMRLVEERTRVENEGKYFNLG
jgi:chromosome segregation ATPase